MEMAIEWVRRRDRKLKRKRCNVARPKDWPKHLEDNVCKRPWVSGGGEA